MINEQDFNFTQDELEILFWAEYWALKNEAKSIGNVGSLMKMISSSPAIEGKDLEVRMAKNKWIEEWSGATRKLLNINYHLSESDLKIKFQKHLFSDGKLLAFAVESSAFTAYFPLKLKDKRYKGLEFREDVYLAKMASIVPKYGPELSKCRDTLIKYQKKLAKAVNDSRNILIWVSLAAAAALLVAPYLGAAIGGIMGLHGIAATNAGLAFLGFGSLAAGGLGMMGGTVAVMAGGSLLAYGTSTTIYKEKVREASNDELLMSCAKLIVVLHLLGNQPSSIRELCQSARILQNDLEKDADEYFIIKQTKEGKSSAKKAVTLIAFRKLIRDLS